MDKDTKRLVKEAAGQGFQVTYTTKGHPVITNLETGESVTMSGTPSDHRAFANAVARLRRIGFKWPPKR